MAKHCIFEPCHGKKKELKTCGIAGIRTLIQRSQERDDALHVQLEDVLASDGDKASVTCHKSCYSSYTSVSRNDSGNKRKSDLGLSDEPPQRISRSQVSDFVFKRDCLFCGEICVPKDPKNSHQWVPVSQCETEARPGQDTFKHAILDMCDARQDDWSRMVEVRINGAQIDLPAADRRYHTHCYNKFRKVPIDSRQSESCKPCVDESLRFVINHMNRNMCETWTVADLHTVYIQNDGHLTRKQMLVHLTEYFGEEIVVVHLEGCSSIVGFRKFVSKSLKLEKQSCTSDADDDVDRLVRRIKAEVRSIPLPRDYDLNIFQYEKVVQDTSATLLSLISSLVANGKVSKASLTLSQCVQQHVKSTNQTTLELAVKLHHKFGSSDLVSTLNEHGIVSSYDEVLHFRKSAAKYVCENSDVYHRVMGLERRLGPIFSWCDNYDLVVFTPNGRRSTHAMAIEFTQHPAGIIHPGSATPGVMSLKIPRLRKAEAAKLCLTLRSFTIEHYTGPKKMNPPTMVEVPLSLSESQLLSASLAQAQTKDAAYFSQLHSENPVEWSGLNAINDRAQVNMHINKPKTLCIFGPLIDSPPAHPDTVLTTIDYIDRTLKSLGMIHVQITLDMQLYIVSCLIKWSDPVRWQSVVLRPGMMHTLMSFIGTIGHNMKGTGVEELIGAAYSGLPNIFNGKAWPKAMRAFRMVVAALLHDFLQDGEKHHGDIATYIDKAREHPTGKLWVDCFIVPTMIAHQFLRAEREGNWLMQQHCLEKMLPYFFEAGHHNYARYISWHLRDMQNLPQDAKKDLLDGAHVCRHSEGAAAVSGDQFGEQTYIKQGKQAGGMKEISTNPQQVAVWIESLGICSHVSMAMDDMYSPECNTSTPTSKHKEEGEKRRDLDKQD